MDDVEWHYESKGKRRGPVSAADIRALIEDATIDAQTLVWKQGFREWSCIEDTDLRKYIRYGTRKYAVPWDLSSAAYRRNEEGRNCA
jgi:hypothetical protein